MRQEPPEQSRQPRLGLRRQFLSRCRELDASHTPNPGVRPKIRARHGLRNRALTAAILTFDIGIPGR